MKMSEKELLAITGGELSFSVIAGIGALITFIIGVVDGYVRPQKCN